MIGSGFGGIESAVNGIDVSPITDALVFACCIAGVAIGLRRSFLAVLAYIGWSLLRGNTEGDFEHYIELAVVLVVMILVKWLYDKIMRRQKRRNEVAASTPASA